MLKVHFPHGLGDCVYFAHQLPLYTRRGHRFMIACSPDKHILFAASGVEVTADISDAAPVAWREGACPNREARWNNGWRWSKPAGNISAPPMPEIGAPEDLWDEYCNIRLNIWPYLPPEAQSSAEEWLRPLARPVILLHTHGNLDAQRKNLANEQCWQLYRLLLEETGGTLVLLDWDNRAPRLAHWRVRHLTDDWMPIDTAQLVALIGRADLMIGVDSGPLHAARLTGTPSIGVWMRDGATPTWCLPRASQVNLVVGGDHRNWSRRSRVPFNIVECLEPPRVPELLTVLAKYMLEPPRYLHATRRGADALLQWFVRQRMYGYPSVLGAYGDRNRGFDVILRVMSERFLSPRVVETGCIREEDDFARAGFSTYVFGCYLHDRQGRLTSVDNSPENCAFAREWTECFGDAVEVVQCDSMEWLRGNRERIDVLYLDSLDLQVAGNTEHCLAEVQAAYGCLHDGSLVVFDDTVYRCRGYHGKGSLAVPWLLERGWRIIHSGYQTVLSTNAPRAELR